LTSNLLVKLRHQIHFFLYRTFQKFLGERERRTSKMCHSWRSWIFSWAMSHICANDEYRSQVGTTNRPENIVIRYVSFVSLSSICMYKGCFFQFGVEVGVELSIVNALYRLRITDQLFKSYAFIRVVRSQLTLQRLLRRQI
jgi:hypothetical protein